MHRFLKNRNTKAALGPFDGVVAAVCKFEETDYLLTTHIQYVPAIPSTREHSLFLRSDLRYGPDDFTRWPQQYDPTFCHLPCVRTRADSPPELDILWWDPLPDHFVKPSADSTLVPNLGKLDSGHFKALADVVQKLSREHFDYVKAAGNSVPRTLGPLLVSLNAALERLRAIPLSFDEMVLTVTRLQITWLEIDAMIQYMTVYKPRIENPWSLTPTESAHCVGTFTADPQAAQMLHRAGLPYWFIRPAANFAEENIWAIVDPVLPSTSVRIDAHPRQRTMIITGNQTASKIAAIHQHTMTRSWYKDPYDLIHAGSTGGNGRTEQRYNPYAKPAAKLTPRGSSGRDKYEALDRPEMAETIPCWQRALKDVDTTHPPSAQRDRRDTHYVFPEPALLAAPDDPNLRRQRLFHFELMKDALSYRLGNDKGQGDVLLFSSQEWREILSGKVARNASNTKTQQRIGVIERLLEPALRACGVEPYRDLPVPTSQVPRMTYHRAKEIVWSVAEMNFRFELLALDRRASGLDRSRECLTCFPSPRMLDIPLVEGKRGFAAMTLQDCHPSMLRLARLMLEWRGCPIRIRELAKQSHWSKDEISTLASLVPQFYCQQFYEHFGRAAVVPLRLEHEFGH